MKIPVLGGTGAMGVNLVKILGEHGENVTVTSRLERNASILRRTQKNRNEFYLLSEF